jgi:hypothetical protein
MIAVNAGHGTFGPTSYGDYVVSSGGPSLGTFPIDAVIGDFDGTGYRIAAASQPERAYHRRYRPARHVHARGRIPITGRSGSWVYLYD